VTPKKTSSRRCTDHPAAPAVAQCVVCRRAICDGCYRFRANDRAACARCAYEISSRPRRFVSIALSLLGLGWGSTWLLSRRPALWEEYQAFAYVLTGLATVVAFVFFAFRKASDAPAITSRPEEPPAEELIEDPGAAPYRARIRRALPPPAPRVSATWTVIALLASLAVAALTLPRLSDMPRWLEAELVLGIWWLAWTAVLSTLLYRGFKLADDWIYFAPWDRGGSGGRGSTGSRWSLNGCDPGCSVDGEGCLAAIAIALALAVLVGAAWVLVEIAVPVVFLLAYTLIVRALRRVAHDRHGCEGRLGASIGWGAMWSAVYVAPIAVVIALLRVATSG
jgi:hypothetical protein